MGKSTRLEPDVARQLVAECNRLIMRLERHLNDAKQLANLTGFGDIPSAQALQAGFARKAIEGETSVRGRIEQFRDQLVQIRDNFDAGGEAFLTAEESNRAALRAVGDQL